VGTTTVSRIESANSGTTTYISTLTRIQAAFEDAGIVFIDDDGSAGIGVRLAKSRRSKKK
jgi:hypothetical protein